MKSYSISLLLSVLMFFCRAQDTVLVLKPEMIDSDSMQIFISEMEGWIFRPGHDTSWANLEIDTVGWQKLMPAQLTEAMADKNGKLESWFRIKIKLDSTFGEIPLGIRVSTWAASDLYINGKKAASFGNTGANGLPYRENVFSGDLLPVPLVLKMNQEYSLALHVVDYLSPFPPYELKSKDPGLASLIRITGPKYNKSIIENVTRKVYANMFLAIISAVLSLLFWLLYFQNRGEKNMLLFAAASTFLSISLVSSTLVNNKGASYGGLSYNWVWILQQTGWIFLLLFIMSSPFVIARIFKRRMSRLLLLLFIVILTILLIFNFQIFGTNEKLGDMVIVLLFPLNMAIGIYYMITSWKSLRGAQWAVVAGLMILLFILLFALILSLVLPERFAAYFASLWSMGLISFPMSLMVYVVMRFKEIINEVRENANQIVKMSEEKKEQALNQQKVLEQEVTRQTAEIRSALTNLKATQAQLIQSEKMASLGELTAGIAHEIQNPLNFVNNFSELNKELLEEMNEEIEKGNMDEVKAIARDVMDNEDKIKHHGQRAEAIVKGMLEHSRTSSAQKEPTDINALCDEYLRLAYHGLRAKDKSFNATMETHFDTLLPKIEVIPQDIGRVVLNLIINAFQAVNERNKKGEEGYKPKVTITTQLTANNQLLIAIKDNGPGIPEHIKGKIFQPFFTTKPTGQGTGLGLSLSYDIVKAHGGEIKLESKVGEGTTFNVILPID